MKSNGEKLEKLYLLIKYSALFLPSNDPLLYLDLPSSPFPPPPAPLHVIRFHLNTFCLQLPGFLFLILPKIISEIHIQHITGKSRTCQGWNSDWHTGRHVYCTSLSSCEAKGEKEREKATGWKCQMVQGKTNQRALAFSRTTATGLLCVNPPSVSTEGLL